MNISVIIPSFNNCQRLEITLNAFTELKISSGLSWEIVLVNNNSTDATKESVLSFSGKLPIKYIEEPKQGISHSKNAGLKNASGDLVIFTDDDVKPCKNWLLAYWLEYQKNPKGFFWGGPVVSEFEVLPDDMNLIKLGPPSVKGLDWWDRQKELAEGEYFIGANWAGPLNAIKKIGAFNPEMGLNPSTGKVLVGEETDLMTRLRDGGAKAIYLPEASIEHFVPKSKITMRHIAARAEAYGRLSEGTGIDSTAVFLFGAPRWMYRQLFVLWIKSKIKKMVLKNWHDDYLAYRRLLGIIKQIKGK